MSPVIKMGRPGLGSLNRSTVFLACAGRMTRVSPVTETLDELYMYAAGEPPVGVDDMW